MIKYVKSIDELEKNSGLYGDATERAIAHLLKLGINFYDLPHPKIKDGEVVLALARQVQTYNLEHIMADMLAEAYGLKRLDLSLTIDHYVSSPDKLSRVWLRRLKEGRIEDEVIANPKKGEVLRDIKTLDGVTLPEYHKALQMKSKAEMFDVSQMYSSAIAQSLSNGYKHSTIWLAEDGKAKKYTLDRGVGTYRNNGTERSIDEVINLASHGDARPDASWYYENLYLLSHVLIPNMVLVETPWEWEGEKIRTLAEGAYRDIESVTGIQPPTIRIVGMNRLDEERKLLNTEHPSYVILDETPEIPLQGTSDFFADSMDIRRALINYVKSRKTA